MIQVTICQNEKKDCVSFTAKGHAGCGYEGEDVVCAAASVLMINTINAVEKYTGDSFSRISEDPDAMLSFEILEEPSKEAALLLNAMILGLQNMADNEDYAKYIQLTFVEV